MYRTTFALVVVNWHKVLGQFPHPQGKGNGKSYEVCQTIKAKLRDTK
jgi:hypothetical protein